MTVWTETICIFLILSLCRVINLILCGTHQTLFSQQNQCYGGIERFSRMTIFSYKHNKWRKTRNIAENNDICNWLVDRFVILVWLVLRILIMIIQVFSPNMWLLDGTVHQKSCWIPRYEQVFLRSCSIAIDL